MAIDGSDWFGEPRIVCWLTVIRHRGRLVQSRCWYYTLCLGRGGFMAPSDHDTENFRCVMPTLFTAQVAG